MKRALVAAVLLAPVVAHAETPDELLKRGLALYKDGKYPEAVRVLQQAYDADPKPEFMFPLAQAERLAGNCTAAAVHYKLILETIADFNVAKLVRQNLSLCEGPETPAKCESTGTPAPSPTPTPAPAAKPAVTTVEHPSDKVAMVSAGAGALALGVATGFYFASSSTRDAADQAGSLAAHNELSDRADSEHTAMLVSAGIGAAAIGFAAYRWLSHDKAPRTDVALVPGAHGGGAVWLTTRW